MQLTTDELMSIPILERLDELREKATEGEIRLHTDGVLTASDGISPFRAGKHRTREQAHYNKARAVAACNAEESMVRVCRAAEKAIRPAGEGRDEDDWTNLAEALTALREIEP